MNDGLFRIYISNGAYGASGEADSAYEYILKCWIQNGKKDKVLYIYIYNIYLYRY